MRVYIGIERSITARLPGKLKHNLEKYDRLVKNEALPSAPSYRRYKISRAFLHASQP